VEGISILKIENLARLMREEKVDIMYKKPTLKKIYYLQQRSGHRNKR
jgi:hypothetical protein